MKYKSILSLFIFLLGFGVSTTSCEDMLTPDMDRYSEGFSGNDTVYFYLGILRNVQDMVEQNELLSDLRSDLVTSTSYSSDSIADLINYQRGKNGDNALLNRSAYYKVINQCNFYLAKVDTNAIKNNIFYMRREYAQVVAIRAWTYLQLVQTYGKVPFITKPVDNANTGWEKNPENWADADNLVDLLKGDLEKAQVFERTLGYPSYGSYNTGSVNIDSKYLRFYNDLVLGDLYLLRGQSQDDYKTAAKYYYNFLKEHMKKGRGITNSRASFNKFTNAGKDSYYPTINSYLGSGLQAASFSDAYNITVIPSASNSSFGKVLSRTPQIYGFDAKSYNTTSGGENNATDATTSGSISLRANLLSRQAGPSEAYMQLCCAQVYKEKKKNGGSSSVDNVDVEYYEGAGDARMYANIPLIETSDGKARYIVKNSPMSSVSGVEGQAYGNPNFKYYRSIYRLTQVYLRYAEAINRAGYPRLAFTILRDGIDFEKMPTIADSVRYDDVNKTKQTVFYLDSAIVENATNYVGVDELRRAEADPRYEEYLDFSSNMWSNSGIHELGCGTSNIADSIFSYDRVVPERIDNETALYAALGLSVNDTPEPAHRKVAREDSNEGDTEGDGDTEEPNRDEYTEIDPEAPAAANQAEIDAVESIIADEMALELAYEGTRMFDLIRIARHKNVANSGFGTAWLAWKIARRDMPYAPFEQVTQMNNTLYSTLLNPENWYVASPVY